MQLTSRFRIKNVENVIKFLGEMHVGRLSTIDINGYPQIIPMNFVHIITKLKRNNFEGDDRIQNFDSKYKNLDKEFNAKGKDVIDDGINCYEHAIYMHSHHRGEKIENIHRNQKVGFEVDKEICFLPSYYFHPTDASFADTLYTSIVIKGRASMVDNNQEKANAMNRMMQKYQPEDKYAKLSEDMKSIQHLTVIKINVDNIDGKYKVGQEWSSLFRKDIANKIIEREGIKRAREILKDMKINVLSNDGLELPNSINM